MFDYQRVLPNFIAHGNPSEDTLKHYVYEIENWLGYCKDNAYDPIKDIDENDGREYLRFLIDKGYADASINIKLASVRMFYFCAKKLNLRNDNPFEDIRYKSADYDDADFSFLTTEELKSICDKLLSTKNLASIRNLAIVMLMAVEGLRTVEIHRMNDKDFNPKTNSIFIHGKGHNGYIYPCEDTLKVLMKYKSLRPAPIADAYGTPTFIGLATKYYGERISRNGIRFAINNTLNSVIKRRRGESCHMLRHTCGTQLYAQTKDLRLVQETLRQKNPNVTARYAHVQQKLNERNTAHISPLKGVEIDVDDF